MADTECATADPSQPVQSAGVLDYVRIQPARPRDEVEQRRQITAEVERALREVGNRVARR